MDYFVRVRMTSDNILPAIESKIANACERVVAYEHSEKADNIHCHMMLVGCKVSTDTLKNYIRSVGMVPPRAGNKFWSFKDCTNDLDTPVTYMSKGKLMPFYVKGFTQDYLDTCKDRWEERSPKTSQYQARLQYIVRETPSQAKKRKNDLIAEIINIIKYEDKEHIIRCILQVLNDNHVVFGRYTIRDYYDTIMARKYSEKFVHSMIDFVGFRVYN